MATNNGSVNNGAAANHRPRIFNYNKLAAQLESQAFNNEK